MNARNTLGALFITAAGCGDLDQTQLGEISPTHGVQSNTPTACSSISKEASSQIEYVFNNVDRITSDKNSKDYAKVGSGSFPPKQLLALQQTNFVEAVTCNATYGIPTCAYIPHIPTYTEYPLKSVAYVSDVDKKQIILDTQYGGIDDAVHQELRVEITVKDGVCVQNDCDAFCWDDSDVISHREICPDECEQLMNDIDQKIQQRIVLIKLRLEE